MHYDQRALETHATQLAHSHAQDTFFLCLLKGDLGTGKTTYARAFLRALHIDGVLRSPTYTIVQEYTTNSGVPVFHLDLYRLEKEEEFFHLGIHDRLDTKKGIWLIEWPERIPSYLTSFSHHTITLAIPEGQHEERTITESPL